LIKKLQVYFKDDSKKTEVRSIVSSYVSGPHVDKGYVGDCQSEETSRLLKLFPFFTSFLAVSSLDVEDQDLAV
jgi:hypothetical protein